MGTPYASGHPFFGECAGAQREVEDAIKNFVGAMTGHGASGQRESSSGGSGHRKGSRSRHQQDPWSFMFGGPWGPPPWVGGPGSRGPGPRGRWGHGRRDGKARRGDVRAAILSVLAEQSMNGYQVIQEITERSRGEWKPSPGSVYPTLQQLEDEGLVSADQPTGRRVFFLTDEGRSYAEENPEELAAPWRPFDTADEDSEDGSPKPVIGQVAAAMWQVMAAGTPDQQERAWQAMTELRRQLYAILNDDDLDAGENDSTEGDANGRDDEGGPT